MIYLKHVHIVIGIILLRMSFALSLKNLQKTYGNKVNALKGVDLNVSYGDFFALLGPNGAGKTTIIGIVSGLVNKTSGKVSVCDFDIDTNMESARSSIGLVPQEFNFNIFENVIDIVVNQAGYYGVPKKEAEVEAEKLLKQLDLWEKRNEPSRTLSGGMKRRLMIARALVHKPKLLILDEPTAGVDVELRRSMWDFLRELNANGTTIILTTHYLEEAEQLCRNVAIIDKGEIIEQGTVKDLLGRMQRETFMIDLEKNNINHEDAQRKLQDFRAHFIDDDTIEMSIDVSRGLHEGFLALDALGLRVKSMRNKSGRLEELFIHLTQKKNV